MTELGCFDVVTSNVNEYDGDLGNHPDVDEMEEA
jgi:hypothetical protein